jgi:predicted nuclease with TOPRIM domain
MSNIFSTPDQLALAAASVLNGEQLQEAKFMLPPKMQKVLDEISDVTSELIALEKQLTKLNNTQQKLLEKQDKLKDKYFAVDHKFDTEAEEDKATALLVKVMNGK